MSLEWQQDCENENYDDTFRGAKRANKKSRQIKHRATTSPIDEGDNNNNNNDNEREKTSSENMRANNSEKKTEKQNTKYKKQNSKTNKEQRVEREKSTTRSIHFQIIFNFFSLVLARCGFVLLEFGCAW